MIYDFLEQLCGSSTSADIISAGAVILALILIANGLCVLWKAFFSIPFYKK